MRSCAVLLLLVCLGSAWSVDAAASSIVVTTSMLESAAREVLPPEAGLKIVRLIPPASCPGHFDLTPGALRDIRNAVLVLRHDYQGGMEQKLNRINGGARVVAVSTPGSLLIPSNYLKVVEQVALVLTEQMPALKTELNSRMAAVRVRIGDTERALRSEARDLRGIATIASANQKQFCEWLDLKVVSVFPRSEELLPGELASLVSTRAALVVGNLQEGDKVARSLGETLSLPVAIVSNFPAYDGSEPNYDQLLHDNVRRIKRACRQN
jgi:zinc transport system substrate-binding protein